MSINIIFIVIKIKIVLTVVFSDQNVEAMWKQRICQNHQIIHKLVTDFLIQVMLRMKIRREIVSVFGLHQNHAHWFQASCCRTSTKLLGTTLLKMWLNQRPWKMRARRLKGETRPPKPRSPFLTDPQAHTSTLVST